MTAKKKTLKSEPSNPHHGPFIDALGGPARVADEINRVLPARDHITPEAVSNMKRRGVSRLYRAHLANLAKAKNIRLPANFLPGVE